MRGYKGFDKDLKCQNYQFEIGKSYEHPGEAKLCNQGFHFCENPLDCFGYYAPSGSRFAEIEADGVTDEKSGDSKRVCKKITILRELSMSEMTAARIAQMDWKNSEQTSDKENGAATASGYAGAATASGDAGAATASGDAGAATASGNRGAATASGAEGCAMALGIEGTASGKKACWLTLAEWKCSDIWHRINVKTVKVDGKRIKADTFYTLKGGRFVEVK